MHVINGAPRTALGQQLPFGGHGANECFPALRSSSGPAEGAPAGGDLGPSGAPRGDRLGVQELRRAATRARLRESGTQLLSVRDREGEQTGGQTTFPETLLQGLNPGVGIPLHPRAP